MTDRVDIVVTVDGTPVPLCIEVATMVLALVDHQPMIHKQGAGQVAFQYAIDRHNEIEIAISRTTLRRKARHLSLR